MDTAADRKKRYTVAEFQSPELACNSAKALTDRNGQMVDLITSPVDCMQKKGGDVILLSYEKN